MSAYNRRRQNPIKNFSKLRAGTRELDRSYGEPKTSILDNPISVPPNTRRGFIVPLDAHQIKKEDDQASKKRRSSQSSTDEEEDDDDFRRSNNPENTLKIPKRKIDLNAGSSLHIPARRSNLSSSTMTNDQIFESASPPDSPQATLMLPKKIVNPFATNGLRVPAKKKARMDVEELERMQSSLVEGQKDYEREAAESDRRCDFCGEQLWPITEPIRKALEELEKKNEAYAKQQKQHHEEIQAASSFTAPTGFVISRPVLNEEKDKFCKVHRIQLVTLPEGIKNGYPRQIDFSKIQERIVSFKNELDEVICGKINSEYKEIAEKAYREQGQTKARSVMSVLNRFTATLPGYYGPRGAGAILKALTKMYIDTGYMRKHLKSSQLPLEFLQQVLVPEVGFRLIRQDLNRKRRGGVPIPGLTEKAKAIMKESAAYGNAMFPVEDADIDDDRVSSINCHQEDEANDSDEDEDDDDQVEIKEVYAIDSD